AHRIGLVHEVVAADALDAKVEEIVRSLSNAAPAALGECKRLLRDVTGQPITEQLTQETVRRIAAIRSTDEAREGLQSFLQKRKPSWLLAK
ncbi:MAG: enoyl-CoA hydratase/isomerase family protein, partial [Comamonadaceae bacterium]